MVAPQRMNAQFDFVVDAWVFLASAAACMTAPIPHFISSEMVDLAVTRSEKRR
jgi:hypothetical protein